VGASISDTFSQSISVNACNVVKLKCIPTVLSASTEFFIYKDSTYADADRAYATKAYTGNLIDPIEDNGSSVLERNEGFVCAFEDKQSANMMYFKIKNNSGAPCTYNVTVEYDANLTGSSGLVLGVPSGLFDRAVASYRTILLAVAARVNASTIDQAELRMIFIPAGDSPLQAYDLRSVAEGGTFVDNGTTQKIITGIKAVSAGAQYQFTSAADGYWYYAWRLHNSIGWSNWTDGNVNPSNVTENIKTTGSDLVDTGAPSDWLVTLERGPSSNTVVCRATRPNINGAIIMGFTVQILDADTGTWKTLFAGSDAGHMKWDGRLVSYSLSADRTQLTDAGAGGFGTAAAGDLVLVDVRGGVWNEQNVQWATVYSVTATTLTINGFLRPQVTSDLRLIIVKPPWEWSTNGYLGATANRGMYPQQNDDPNAFIGDTQTTEFVTSAIKIPSTVTNPQARVWFDNLFSRADNNLTHSVGLGGLPTARKWINLSDRRWLVPVHGSQVFGSAVMDAAGKVVMVATNPQSIITLPQGYIWGIKSHFHVYPDSTGVIKIRAQFSNVSIPAGLGTQSYESIFIGAIHPNTWTGVGPFLSAIRWGNYQANADVRFENFFPNDSDGNLIYIAGTNHLDVTRPASGYTLELLMGYAQDSTQNYTFGNVTAEYRLNGGSWTPPASVDTKVLPFTPATGFEFVAGIVIPTNGATASCIWGATLDEIEVVQGTIVQNRIQQVR
jgi:hypothetical protein